MPLRCCIICRAEASPDIQLQYCAGCQSALYCSEVCQKTDWKNKHKNICKLVNVGHGGMQVRTSIHARHSIRLEEAFDTEERILDEDDKRFFKLFQESTFEGSQDAAQKMKNYAKKQPKDYQKFLCFHSLRLLVHTSNSEMLSWPNSPLLVLLQFVDPSVLSGNEDEPLQEGETRAAMFHLLADLADPFDYSTHENQLILARQLIEHGANVNTVTRPRGETPLHNACFGDNATNLDFIELLLKAGADPNVKDYMEMTPLMMTITGALGAAKFLLNWPATDVNIAISSNGATFLAMVRVKIKSGSDQIAISDNPNQVQDQFLLQQMREVEEMVVARRRR
jgi:hypothetical protein